MSPGDLLDEIRSLYIDRFVQCISEIDPKCKALLEPALLHKDGNYAVEGELSLPCRVDMVVLRDGVAEGSTTIDSDRVLSFDTFDFQWDNGVRISVSPFQWDLCICGLAVVGKAPNWTPIRDWFLKWFEEDESGSEGPLHCVHYLSDPQETEDGFLVEIDFGTAPVKALEEFFDAVGSAGFETLSLGKGSEG